MTWSFNEVEGLARKAARGTGLSWGLAEEAGKSTRWLMAAGLPGAETLAGLLTRNDGADYSTLCPVDTSDTWHSAGGALCPLITGAVLCDHADALEGDDGVQLAATSYPMLLLPFVAGVAETNCADLRITWPGTDVAVTSRGQIALIESATLDVAEVSGVRIEKSDTAVSYARPSATRCEIPEQVAQVLNALAHRTYAPDTPESRIAGAGAGLTDND